jgi:hypothetical protein
MHQRQPIDLRPFLALLATLASCQQGAVTSIRDAGQGTLTTPSDDGGGGPITDPGLHPFPDASLSEAGGNPFDDTPKCAEDIHMAERLPLDLVLLVDRSMSMQGLKWQLTTKALTTFISDPRSAGLGVGLQFFPVSEVEKSCKANVDCGGIDSICADSMVCLGPNIDPNKPQLCSSSADAACPAGTTCVPLGECAQSSTFCTAIGKPCPGGPPTDLCTALGKTCRKADFSESCSADQYTQLNVRVGPLPLAQAALIRVITATLPDGGTPMAQAVQGTLAVLRAYQAANPTHRVVLILATDGVPSNCGVTPGGNTPQAAIVANLTAARMMTPPISTYAIGTFAPDEGTEGPMAVNSFAMAGGTGTAFVLNPTTTLADDLLGALNQIRGAALPCAFTIPMPKSGALDFDKVNVHFKGAANDENVPYVGSADKCDPVRGGWYYDVDPAKGDPKQVIVCGKTCDLFKTEATGKVEIGFGCKTVVIQ